MAEFLLSCKCGQMKIYHPFIENHLGKKRWVIKCLNCNAYVESDKREKAIEKWNNWDLFHENKIHTEMKDGLHL